MGEGKNYMISSTNAGLPLEKHAESSIVTSSSFRKSPPAPLPLHILRAERQLVWRAAVTCFEASGAVDLP